MICRDKSCLDIEKAKSKIEKCMRSDFYYLMREWPYKNVKRRIIAEPLIEDNESLNLKDYKFYCFNRKVKYCQLIANRSSEETIDFFDENWNHQPFVGLNPVCSNAPVNYKQMIILTDQLAEGFPFVRVDFYNINGRILFGEMTFFPAGGFGTFTPIE